MKAADLAFRVLQNVTHCKYLYAELLDSAIADTAHQLNVELTPELRQDTRELVIKVLQEEHRQ